IANSLAVAIYSEGYSSLFKLFKTMSIIIGLIALNFAMERDTKRILVADRRHHAASKEAKI
ncbi:hypothetical protein WH47_07700, partial [Habropoda laboriosa]